MVFVRRCRAHFVRFIDHGRGGVQFAVPKWKWKNSSAAETHTATVWRKAKKEKSFIYIFIASCARSRDEYTMARQCDIYTSAHCRMPTTTQCHQAQKGIKCMKCEASARCCSPTEHGRWWWKINERRQWKTFGVSSFLWTIQLFHTS